MKYSTKYHVDRSQVKSHENSVVGDPPYLKIFLKTPEQFISVVGVSINLKLSIFLINPY